MKQLDVARSRVVVPPTVAAMVTTFCTLPCITGFVRVLFVRVLVLDIVGIVTHSTATTPDDTRVIVVSLACHTFTHANCGLSLVQSPMSAGIDDMFSSSISPDPAVLLPSIRLVFMFCILGKVTESSIISAVMLGVASLYVKSIRAESTRIVPTASCACSLVYPPPAVIESSTYFLSTISVSAENVG